MAGQEQSPNIHLWFELSYSSYLTVPRTVLQSMPDEWQRRFTRCLEEMDAAIDWRPKPGLRYRVGLFKVDESAEGDEPFWGEEMSDPLEPYNRGRRQMLYRCAECGSSDPNAQICNRCRKLAEKCTCLDQEAIKAGHCRRVPCPSPLHPKEL